MCELKDLLNLLKVELFVADSYEEDFDDDDVPNEDMFDDNDIVENEKNLDDNDFVENYSQIDVTEFKIEPNFPGNVKFKKHRQLKDKIGFLYSLNLCTAGHPCLGTQNT